MKYRDIDAPRRPSDARLRLLDAHVSGKRILQSIERMLGECEEKGIHVEAVRCPHTSERPICDITYLGLELQLCQRCHDLVAAEFRRQQKVFAKKDYRAMARQTMGT